MSDMSRNASNLMRSSISKRHEVDPHTDSTSLPLAIVMNITDNKGHEAYSYLYSKRRL